MKNTAILFALLLMASAVNAEILDFPTEVRFHERPVELSFKVANDTPQAQPLSVDVQVVPFTVISEPPSLAPGETGEVRLRLVPPGDLLGSTYQSLVSISLGGQVTRKNILLVFEPAEEATPAAAPEVAPATEAPKAEQAQNPLESASAAAAAFVVLPKIALDEGLLNAVLAVIAALLLISFIARLTKRVVQKGVDKQ